MVNILDVCIYQYVVFFPCFCFCSDFFFVLGLNVGLWDFYALFSSLTPIFFPTPFCCCCWQADFFYHINRRTRINWLVSVQNVVWYWLLLPMNVRTLDFDKIKMKFQFYVKRWFRNGMTLLLSFGIDFYYFPQILSGNIEQPNISWKSNVRLNCLRFPINLKHR